MREDAIIRPAEPADADSIVEVIRSGIPPDVLDMVIYGCDGVARYVHDHVATAGPVDTTYTVADVQGRVVGCVELRCYAEGPFVNYISVLPEARSCGLGRRLLLSAVEATCPIGGAVVRLDVLETNTAARAWYEKLGFRQEHSTIWFDRPIRSEGCPGWSVIRGMPQSRAACQRFGFGQFDIITDRSIYAIGVLGSRWFRVVDEQAAADRGVHSTLSRLERERRMLALVRDGSGVSSQYEQGTMVARLHRLRADLRDVVLRLK